MGGGKKSSGSEGLGRALMRQHTKMALEAKEKGRTLRAQRRGLSRQPLESIIDVSDIDAVLERAADADRALSFGMPNIATSKDDPILISLDGKADMDDLLPEEERRLRKEEEAMHASSLRVPRRPPWNTQMTVEELDANERQAFLEWRRTLARLEQNEKLILTPFEKNLDIWRQLWRVLERSHLLVMVVDARDPLFYRCPDLEEYAIEIDEHKKTMLLINKADLLPLEVRKRWAQYFHHQGVLFAFWSAKAASAALEGKILEHHTSGGNGASELELDTQIYGRDELLARLQSDAKAVRAMQRASSATGSEGDDSSDADSNNAKQVVVGFVGYPNVGKSSTINALVGQKRTGVTSTPGKTKHFQTLIISEELMLCDCPGLVFPSFSSSRHEMVALGVLPIDRMTQHREAVQVVANNVPRDALESIYNINLPKPKPYESQSRPPLASELLRAYCASRRHVSSSGLPDETRAARQILKDYLDGKLPHYEFPPGVNINWELGQTDVYEQPPAAAAAVESGASDSDYLDDSASSAPASKSDKPSPEHILQDLDSIHLTREPSKESTNSKKMRSASAHKHHKKTQRKKDRSWRVGNDGGDGMPVVRAIQKPAVNLSALRTSGSV